MSPPSDDNRDLILASLMAAAENLSVNMRILRLTEQILEANHRSAALFEEILKTLKGE